MLKLKLFSLFFLLTACSAWSQDTPKLAEDITPLLIGETIPSVSVTDIRGKTQNIQDILKKKRSVLLFYRGGWCPYCNQHLAEIGGIEKKIIELGYQIIAISPDSPKNLENSSDKNNLNYDLYSDNELALGKAMGIAFQAPKRYQKILDKYSENRNSNYLLPVPSVFIVNTKGNILFEYINPDYKNRVRGNLILAVLKELAP